MRRMQHKTALYRKLLQSFVKAQADAPALVRAAWTQGNPKLAERTAHTLRGVAGNVGAETVAARSEQLEMAIRLGLDSALIEKEIRATESALAPLIEALQTYLEATEPAVPALPGQAAQDRPVPWDKLRALLQKDDAAATDCFQESEAAFRHALGAQFEAMQQAMQAFDFEAALALLQGHGGAAD
jgi:two-component system sensor histidine kinase/response regulator